MIANRSMGSTATDSTDSPNNPEFSTVSAAVSSTSIIDGIRSSAPSRYVLARRLAHTPTVGLVRVTWLFISRAAESGSTGTIHAPSLATASQTMTNAGQL